MNTITQERAAEKAREKLAADRAAWRQYACAALAGAAARTGTAADRAHLIAAGLANEMMRLERERFAAEGEP